MGRYNFAAQRVHAHATKLLDAKQLKAPPPWYNVVGTIPPSERLVRPPMQRPQKPGKKASRLFKPLKLSYEEDRLRWEYFNDHPWELARPRVMLENDGRDAQKFDWSVPLDHALNRPTAGETDLEGVKLDELWDKINSRQSGRPLNGEAVVQRQAYLMATGLSEPAAYDKARKELYRIRHFRETEQRVAREEALATGAFFGLGPIEVGMKIEDQHYDNWKIWAEKEITKQQQLQGSAYTGTEIEEDDSALDGASENPSDAEAAN
ncbi:Hypothetical protein R9X50_00476500 [Acrodontium crateriforme]|uniref:Small ribosomal subunit protein mS23 n=1 Tax=Acrodontium crateriforme TaxID=150365 RepID=A0AAQ3R5C3_9PEZI|nr:Hypothetical protein R9X50_00476500 [Acrodontium crateriforme]